MNNWDGLGLALGLGTHKVDEIRRDKQDIAECRKAMLSLWIKEGKASWRCLCLALDDPVVGEKHLARKIANEHKETLQEPVQQSAAPFKSSKDLKEKVHERKGMPYNFLNLQLMYVHVLTIQAEYLYIVRSDGSVCMLETFEIFRRIPDVFFHALIFHTEHKLNVCLEGLLELIPVKTKSLFIVHYIQSHHNVYIFSMELCYSGLYKQQLK